MTHADPHPTIETGIPRTERERLLLEIMERMGDLHTEEFSEEQRGDLRNIFQDSMNAWLDAKYNAAVSQFGKWALRTILVLLIGAIIVFVLNMNGWRIASAAVSVHSK